MRWTILCELPEPLANKVEGNGQANENHSQSSIHHNWLDVSHFSDPHVEELSHTICPQVLDHRRGNEDFSCNWFVAIDLRVQRGRELSQYTGPLVQITVRSLLTA